MQGRLQATLASYGRGAAHSLSHAMQLPLRCQHPLKQRLRVKCCGGGLKLARLLLSHSQGKQRTPERLMGRPRAALGRRQLSAMSAGRPRCWTMWRLQQRSCPQDCQRGRMQTMASCSPPQA